MYFIYLIFVLLALVHIMKVLKDGITENYVRIAHSFLNVTFYFLALFILFYMGSWLNNVHENYYKTMRERYLKITILRAICSPGNNIHPCNEDTERINTALQEQDERTPLVQPISTTDAIAQESEEEPELPEEKYVKYYNKAMEKNMPKITTFDFIPSLVNITIPLDSQGYTFTIMLTIVSIVYNFL